MKQLLVLHGSDAVEYDSKKLFDTLLRISKFKNKFDIMLISSYPVKNTLIDMVDYFIFDKNVVDDNKTFNNSPYGWTDFGSFKISYIHETYTHFICKLLKKSLCVAKSSGYETFMFIDINKYLCDKHLLDILSNFNNLDFFKSDNNLSLGLICGNVNKFLDTIQIVDSVDNREQSLINDINVLAHTNVINIHQLSPTVKEHLYPYDVSGIFYNRKEKYVHNILLINTTNKIKRYYVISTKSTDFKIDLHPNTFYIDWFDVTNHNFDYSIFVEDDGVICKKINGVITKENVSNISSNRIIEFK